MINPVDTANRSTGLTDSAAKQYRGARIRHWDAVATGPDRWRGGAAYHAWISAIYRRLIPSHAQVLEVGCARGDLLDSLQADLAIGIDFSLEMVRQAKARHPGQNFVVGDAHNLPLRASSTSFDAIILSDLVDDVWDVQAVLAEVADIAVPSTRIVLNFYSRLWEVPLNLVRRLGLAKPLLMQNWLSLEDALNLLTLSNLEAVHTWDELIAPLPLPSGLAFINRYLARLWPVKFFALTHFVVARRTASGGTNRELRVSIIVPARNEAGNIEDIFERIPRMGVDTELIFVEGHSHDDTYAAIQRAIENHSEWSARVVKQQGTGKGDAVRTGFELARGDILMILDADLTVAPEDLPRFCDVLESGRGEFVNGVRLVYPMEQQAMQYLNLIGNKFFSLAFSWLLGQPIKDTLCGTKVLWKTDYERIANNRQRFGDFDPFGDFDLLFGASALNLKIVDMPIRYRERTYGSTNIDRWRHGLLL